MMLQRPFWEVKNIKTNLMWMLRSETEWTLQSMAKMVRYTVIQI